MALVKDKKTAAESAKGATAQGPEQETQTPAAQDSPEAFELQTADAGAAENPETPAVPEGAAENPTEQPSETEETQETSEGAEPGTSEEPAEQPRLLKVTSKAKMALRQPSSGWIIKSGETREMLNDGWLANQLRARLFEIA